MRTSSSTFVSFWNQHIYNRCPGYQTMSNVIHIITTNEILNCLLCNRSVKLIIIITCLPSYHKTTPCTRFNKNYNNDYTSDAISSNPLTCRSFSCLIKSKISGSSSSSASWPVQIVALTAADR